MSQQSAKNPLLEAFSITDLTNELHARACAKDGCEGVMVIVDYEESTSRIVSGKAALMAAHAIDVVIEDAPAARKMGILGAIIGRVGALQVVDND